MNIPAHLAQELLETNFKNICAKLEAGGTLTSAERASMEKFAARAAAPASSSAPVETPVAAPRPAFSLVAGAPLPAKLRDFYQHPHRDYIPIYQLSPKHGDRTIKRWVSIGRHATPPEPPPLDDPPAMAAWWRRHSNERPPQIFVDYETAPRPASSPNPAESPEVPAAATDTAPPLPRESIALSGLGLVEGEVVEQMRAIVKGNYQRVETALAAGLTDDYARWFPIYATSAESLRKLEKEYRESAKASGAMLSRSQVISELAQLLEALRLMREAMPQKILAELSKRAEGRRRRVLRMIEPDLVTAILAVRAREADILTTIDLLRSPAAAREAFALEAA